MSDGDKLWTRRDCCVDARVVVVAGNAATSMPNVLATLSVHAARVSDTQTNNTRTR